MFHGIFNDTRVCVYHVVAGAWIAQVWYRHGWGEKFRIPAKLGMRLVAKMKGRLK